MDNDLQVVYEGASGESTGLEFLDEIARLEDQIQFYKGKYEENMVLKKKYDAKMKREKQKINYYTQEITQIEEKNENLKMKYEINQERLNEAEKTIEYLKKNIKGVEKTYCTLQKLEKECKQKELEARRMKRRKETTKAKIQNLKEDFKKETAFQKEAIKLCEELYDLLMAGNCLTRAQSQHQRNIIENQKIMMELREAVKEEVESEEEDEKVLESASTSTK